MTRVKAFRVILNSNGESGHSCLLLTVMKMCRAFLPLHMMLPMGLSCISLTELRYVPSIFKMLKVFTMKAYCILSNSFSESVEIFRQF